MADCLNIQNSNIPFHNGNSYPGTSYIYKRPFTEIIEAEKKDVVNFLDYLQMESNRRNKEIEQMRNQKNIRELKSPFSKTAVSGRTTRDRQATPSSSDEGLTKWWLSYALIKRFGSDSSY